MKVLLSYLVELVNLKNQLFSSLKYIHLAGFKITVPLVVLGFLLVVLWFLLHPFLLTTKILEKTL